MNGVVDIDLTGLSGGAKEALVNFTTSDKYNFNATTNAKFTVYRNVSSVVVTQDNKNVIATVTDGATGSVTFYVNGKKYVAPIENNVARWNNILEIGNW